jgi:hypothetical protein
VLNKLKSQHTKRARQPIFPLSRLKRFGMGPPILKTFYSCTIESILTGCITAWYGNCLASDRKALQRVVCTAQYITGAKLPAIQDLYNQAVSEEGPKNCQTPVTQVIDCSLCYRMASGTRAPKSRSKRLLNSFYPQAIRQLNIYSNGYPDYLHFPPFSPFYTTATLCCHLCIVTLIALPTCTYYLN